VKSVIEIRVVLFKQHNQTPPKSLFMSVEKTSKEFCRFKWLQSTTL